MGSLSLGLSTGCARNASRSCRHLAEAASLQAQKAGHMISILQSLRTMRVSRSVMPPLLAAQERRLHTLLLQQAEAQASSEQPW